MKAKGASRGQTTDRHLMNHADQLDALKPAGTLAMQLRC
jgi:hypothetical protein